MPCVSDFLSAVSLFTFWGDKTLPFQGSPFCGPADAKPLSVVQKPNSRLQDAHHPQLSSEPGAAFCVYVYCLEARRCFGGSCVTLQPPN